MTYLNSLSSAPGEAVVLRPLVSTELRRTGFLRGATESSLFGYFIGERLLTTTGEPIEKHQIHFGSASNDVTLFD
jgi:hypothetical protein